MPPQTSLALSTHVNSSLPGKVWGLGVSLASMLQEKEKGAKENIVPFVFLHAWLGPTTWTGASTTASLPPKPCVGLVASPACISWPRWPPRWGSCADIVLFPWGEEETLFFGVLMGTSLRSTFSTTVLVVHVNFCSPDNRKQNLPEARSLHLICPWACAGF